MAPATGQACGDVPRVATHPAGGIGRGLDARLLFVRGAPAAASMISQHEAEPSDAERPLYASRREAGRLLGARVAGRGFASPVVVALPGSGALLASEVALALRAPLEVFVPCRSEHAPGLAGCLCSRLRATPAQRELVEALALASAERGGADLRLELAELRRREQACRGGRPPLALSGRSAILVDEGADGAGALRACTARLRGEAARRVVLALPAADVAAVGELSGMADEVVPLFVLRALPGRLWGDERAAASDDEVAAQVERCARAAT